MILPPLAAPNGTRARYLVLAALGPLAQESETGAQRQQHKGGHSQVRSAPPAEQGYRRTQKPICRGRENRGDTRREPERGNQEQMATHSVPPGHTPSVTLYFY